MSHLFSTRWIVLLAAFALLPMRVPTAQAASADLDQIRNGSADQPVDPPSWVNGNAGAQNAHYKEGMSIGYRLRMTGLPTNTPITVTIGYDTKRSGKHAIDYVTNYQRLEPHHWSFGHETEVIDPLIGVTGLTGTVSTYLIPPPSSATSVVAGQPATSYSKLTEAERSMTLFGGTLTGISYAVEGSLAQDSAETQIAVTLTVDGPNAVLAWGGHIASRLDWGFEANGSPLSAAGISGSSYHTRLVGWSLGSLGSTDRSLSADAVVVPPPQCSVEVAQGELCAGGSVKVCVTTTDGQPPFTYAWTGPNGFTATTSCIDINNVQTTGTGTYSVVVTDSRKFSSSSCGFELKVNPAPTANAGAAQTQCASKTGATVFTLAGSGSNGTPSWSVLNQSITPDGEITITANPDNAYAPQVSFPAGSTGTATVRLTMSGSVESSCGSATADVVLTVNPNPAAEAGEAQTQCAEKSGQTCFTLAGSGAHGTPAWSVVERSAALVNTTVNISGAAGWAPQVCFPAGATGWAKVRLTVTSDRNPACGTATDDVVLTVEPNPTSIAGDDQKLCASKTGATVFTLAGSGSDGAPSWSVFSQSITPDGQVTIADNAENPYAPQVTFPAGSTGTATIRLTVTSNLESMCGTSTDDVVLTVNPNPTAEAGEPQTQCASKSGESCFTLAGSGSAGTPAWSVVERSAALASAAINVSGAATWTPQVCFPAGTTGWAKVRLTVTSNQNPACGTATDDVLLTVNPNPTAVAGKPQTQCASKSGPTCFTLAGSGTHGTPSWSAVDRSAELAVGDVTITNADTWAGQVCFRAGTTGWVKVRLTVTSSFEPNCGTASEEIVLTVNPNPTAVAGPTQVQCMAKTGQTCFTLDGSGTHGAPTWSVVGKSANLAANAVTISAPASWKPQVCFAAGSAGWARLRLTVTSGFDPSCGTAADEVTLTVNPLPVCGIRNVPPMLVGPDNMQSYNWTLPDNTTAEGKSIAIPVAGTYQLTIVDGNGCSSSCSMLIVGPSDCVVTPDRTEVCAGQTAAFTVTFQGGTAPFQYKWDGPEGFTATSQSITVGTDGTYSVTVTDANNLSVSGCAGVLVVNPNPVAKIVLPPEPMTCYASGNPLSVTVSEGLPPYTYEWSVDCSDWRIDAGQTTEQISYSAGSGTATFTVRVTDSKGCVGTDHVQMTCPPRPPIAEFCSLTQGAYGNPGGQWNGIPRLELIQQLLSQGPLVLGQPSLSLTILATAAQCIIDRLPAGGPADSLPKALGDATLSDPPGCQTPKPLPVFHNSGKFKNVFLGQAITLALNLRLDPSLGGFELTETFCVQDASPGPDGLRGTGDDIPDPGPDGVYGCHNGDIDDPIRTIHFPVVVLTALDDLGLPRTVNGLMELAKIALAAQPTAGAKLIDINSAVSLINETFDECRFVVHCPGTYAAPAPPTPVAGTSPLPSTTSGADPIPSYSAPLSSAGSSDPTRTPYSTDGAQSTTASGQTEPAGDEVADGGGTLVTSAPAPGCGAGVAEATLMSLTGLLLLCGARRRS